MRLLQVVPSLASRTGGPAVSVVESSLALQRLGIDVTIFTTDMAEAASSARHTRARAADLPAGSNDLDVRMFRARAPHRLAFAPGLWRALRAEVHAYDVVHIHSLFLFPQFVAHRAALAAGVPYVVSPRGALDPYLRRRRRGWKAVAGLLWQRRMLESAGLLHTTSREEARLIADVAPHVQRSIVPNGVGWADYERLPSGDGFRRRYLGGSRDPLVLYLGRVSHKKGLDILIGALALLRRRRIPCRLAIVGPDDEGLTSALQALAVKEGVADRIVFTGMLIGTEKLDALGAADVWALPSHTENFGNAVVEALSAGLPVAISPAVNISREVADAGAGIVAPLTPTAFARAIGTLLGDEAERAAQGVRARAFARRYDWSVVGPRLAEMYDDVAGPETQRSQELPLCA